MKVPNLKTLLSNQSFIITQCNVYTPKAKALVSHQPILNKALKDYEEKCCNTCNPELSNQAIQV